MFHLGLQTVEMTTLTNGVAESCSHVNGGVIVRVRTCFLPTLTHDHPKPGRTHAVPRYQLSETNLQRVGLQYSSSLSASKQSRNRKRASRQARHISETMWVNYVVPKGSELNDAARKWGIAESVSY